MSKKNKDAFYAGIMDGEGCFEVSRTKKEDGTYKYNAVLRIEMTNPFVLQQMKEHFNVGKLNKKGKRESRKQIYYYKVYGKDAKQMVLDMKDHLIVKYDEAVEFLKFLETTHHDYEERTRIHKVLRDLKQREYDIEI